MKALRLDVRVRNNRLVTAREELGLTQTAAAEASGVNLSVLNGLETCRTSAMHATTGRWREVAVTVAAFYGYSPEYLWPDEVRALKKRAATMFVDAGDVARLLEASPDPERRLLIGTEASSIRSALKTLTPREQKVLRMRFGIDEKSDHSLDEVGQHFEVGKERIRQFEQRALGKLRHPKRRRPLVEAMVDAPADQWTCKCGRVVERALVCGNCGAVSPLLLEKA